MEETLLAHSASADSIETPLEVIGSPPRSGEPAPIGTSSPIVVSGDGGFDPNEGSRKDDLQDMEAESDEAKEKFSLAKEVLELRGIDASPAQRVRPLKLNLM